MAIDFTPSGNVGSQVERAVVAHLEWFLAACNLPPINFYFANDGRDRQPPLIEVLAHKSTEGPTHSRDEIVDVRIELEWPGVNQPSQPNPDWNWVQVNKFIGSVMAAMSISDNGGQDYAATCASLSQYGRLLATDASKGGDPVQVKQAADNYDMVNFTAQYLRYKGFQRAMISNGALYFREIRNFEIDACAANVD
jgi:hypothetical protein